MLAPVVGALSVTLLVGVFSSPLAHADGVDSSNPVQTTDAPDSPPPSDDPSPSVDPGQVVDPGQAVDPSQTTDSPDPATLPDPSDTSDPALVTDDSCSLVMITLDPGDGGVVDPTSVCVDFGAPIGQLPTPTLSGFYFLGWYDENGIAVKATDLTPAGPTPVTLAFTAHWLKARHYVFNANGGKVGTETTAIKEVKPGTKIGTLPSAARTYYKFLGWYTKKTGGSKVTSATVAPKTAGTTTLYAHWQAMRKYSFYANGGKVSVTSKTVKAGAKLGSLPKASRSYFTFMGWYTAKAHGGSHVSSSTKASKSAGSSTLYARWAPYPMYQFSPAWRAKRYSLSNMANEGCCPAATSIVVRAVGSDTSVTPWTAAKWATSHGYVYKTAIPGRTNPAFIAAYAHLWGITITAIPGASSATADAKALAAVKAGDWVIAFMRPGNWAVHGHYIVWYDVAGSKALVRDPVSISTKRTQGSYKLLQQQAWKYYIVHITDEHPNKVLWQ